MSKKIKWVLIVVLSLVIVVVAGYNIAQNIILSKVQSILTEEKVQQIDNFLREITIPDNISDNKKTTEAGVEATEKANVEPDNSPKVIAENEQNIQPSNTDLDNATSSQSQQTEQSVVIGLDEKANDDNANDDNADASNSISASESTLNVDEIKKSVSITDQVKALELVTKIDVGHVLDMTKPGLTSEVKSDLKEYLKEKYTEKEIAEIYELYHKYSFLLKK